MSGEGGGVRRGEAWRGVCKRNNGRNKGDEGGEWEC